MSGALPVWLVGAGHMGRALLDGWVKAGLVSPSAPAHVVEPHPSTELQALISSGAACLESEFAPDARLVVLAIKPQALSSASPGLKQIAGAGSTLVSILAGIPCAALARAVGWPADADGIVRAMPNTPAAIGKGATAAFVAGGDASPHRKTAAPFLEAAGKLFWLDSEDQIDAVTAVSGSGPAYIFALTEALEAAARAAGLSAPVAAGLARETVIGAAALMASGEETPEALRKAVTSPGGTTEAALKILLGDPGLTALMEDAVLAALARARELGSQG